MKKGLWLLAAVMLICGTVATGGQKDKRPMEPATQGRGALDCTFATVVDCDTTLLGENNIGWPNNVDHYSCVFWTETGGERVYELTVEPLTVITAVLEPVSGDPDVFLLGSCDEADCLAVGEDSIEYFAVEGGLYNLVVDGHMDDSDCVYDLSITCEEALPPPANDACVGAIDLQDLESSVFQIDLCEFTNLYDPEPFGCTGYRAIGPEAVYKIDLEEGEMFWASIDAVQDPIDLSLYLITDCNDPAGSCVTGSDVSSFFTNVESIAYQTTSTGTYYMIVDSYLDCGGGEAEVAFAKPVTPHEGLVGYYPFSGSAEDHSGYGNDGEVFGATLTSDRFGSPNSAYQFDGVNDFIRIVEAEPFHLKSWTITAWINIGDFHKHEILGHAGDVASGCSTFGINLSTRPDEHGTKIQALFENQGGLGRHLFSDEIGSGWIFIAYMRDHASGSTQLFINDYGVVASEIWPDTACRNTAAFLIGKNQDDLNFSPFEGVIDDVRIYANAITAEEVEALYNSDPSSVDDGTPGRAELQSFRPNPFNPRTTVTLWLPQATRVDVSVYDLGGREVAVLASEEYTAGSHTLTWDGRNTHGRAMASGTYIVRLVTEERVESRKVMLVR